MSGSNLFVANQDQLGRGIVGEYTTSGATVNASLITGLNAPYGIAVSGSNLFVANSFSGTVGKYTTSGATVNASLITGLTVPSGIVVVPEPSSIALLAIGATGLAALARRRAA